MVDTTAAPAAHGGHGQHVDEVVRLPDAALSRLREQVAGQVLVPGDDGYDAARRGWSASVVQHPSVVVRATGAADVVAAVRLGAERGMAVGVRGTGHGQVAHDGHVLVDTSAMTSVRLDPARPVAEVAAGADWTRVHHESDARGLGAPAGQAGGVGVAGLTLGGGVGWLVRRYGAACDSLRGADLVTADGAVRRVDAESDPELLWALKGAGAALGIVTRLDLDLHPVRDVLAGSVTWPAARGREVLAAYRGWAATLPDEVTTTVTVVRPPPDAAGGAGAGGATVAVALCHCEPGPAADRVAARLEGLVPGGASTLRRTTYLRLLGEEVAPGGMREYATTALLDDLPDDLVGSLLDRVEQLTLPLEIVELRQLGGAFARVPGAASALAHRRAPFMVQVQSAWGHDGTGEQRRADVDALTGVVARFADDRGVLLNFLGEGERAGAASRVYPRGVRERLAGVKARVDPADTFRVTTDVAPAAAGSA